MSLDALTSPTLWLTALGIFFLRALNISLDTARILFVVKGRKLQTWLLGFFQSLLYVTVIGFVLAELDQPLYLLFYAAGFATGTVVGMVLTERLALGFIHYTIVSASFGTAIAEHLRSKGFAVTEIPGRGRDGMVTVLHCDIRRREMLYLEKCVLEVDSAAFITAEEVRPVRRGFWRTI